LAEGFFFEQVLTNDHLHSDFFGEHLIVQSIKKEGEKYEEYKLKFANNTHYDIIGKDMVVIDFSGETVVEDVLPKSDKKKEDLRNCLCKFNLVKGSPNKITLEFIDYLPPELKIERFDEENYLFFSRHLEEKYLTFWEKNKCLGKFELTHDEKVVGITKLDDCRMLVEYTRYVLVVDFLKCQVINKIDMKSRIPNIRFNCSIEQAGDYYHETLLIEQEELGAWRNYILDQNFDKVLEIEGDDYLVFYE